MDEVKRGPGRPRNPNSLRSAGCNMTFRARAGLREKLEAVAGASQRSLSEEIETRLLASFETPDLLNAIRDTIRAELKS